MNPWWLGTGDAELLMDRLRRFGSVTVVERPYSSDRAESRRQHDLSYGTRDILSANPPPAKVRDPALSSAGGSASQDARNHHVSEVKHPRSLSLSDTTIA